MSHSPFALVASSRSFRRARGATWRAYRRGGKKALCWVLALMIALPPSRGHATVAPNDADPSIGQGPITNCRPPLMIHGYTILNHPQEELIGGSWPWEGSFDYRAIGWPLWGLIGVWKYLERDLFCGFPGGGEGGGGCPSGQCCDNGGNGANGPGGGAMGGPPNPLPPAATGDPVYLHTGEVGEAVTDLTLTGPVLNWSMTRSYVSGLAGGTSLGTRWLGGQADMYLVFGALDSIGVPKVHLIRNAASKIEFTRVSGSISATDPPVFKASDDSNLVLTYRYGGTDPYYLDEAYLTSHTTNERWVFWGLNTPTGPISANIQGRLKEQTTRQLTADGKKGFEYSHDSNGKLTSIVGASGQDGYTINFDYAGGPFIKKVTIKKGTTLLRQAEYKYRVSSDIANLGSVNDLIQVKVMARESGDTSATGDADTDLKIVRYTQYRYTDTHSRLKAIYEHDAIERACDWFNTTPAGLLSKNDKEPNPGVNLEDFASRSFEYYQTDEGPTFDTKFVMGENLATKYGGFDIDEAGRVKRETIRGSCASCGGSTGNAAITKEYYYLVSQSGPATNDQNRVYWIVVEDTVVGTAGKYRVVYGLERSGVLPGETSGRMLRKAFIENPAATPQRIWCESWKLATTGMRYRVAEYRMPSAHNVTGDTIDEFLKPFDGTSWSNDDNTLRDADGLIYLYDYNAQGMRTDWKVKKGRNGTANYVAAADYPTSGTGSGDGYLMTKTYYYPTATTNRGAGIATSFDHTFYNGDYRQLKTRTATLPAIATGQNGSGSAVAAEEYFDAYGRLRWTRDGEGYVNYISYNPVTGGIALSVGDIDPASVGSDVSDGSTANWESWEVAGANSNKPTRASGLPAAHPLAGKVYHDPLGRRVLEIDPGGRQHGTAYKNEQTIQFPFWNGSSTTLLPIRVRDFGDGVHVTQDHEVRAGYDDIVEDTNLFQGLTVPTGFSAAPSQTSFVSLTRATLDSRNGMLVHVDRYHDIPIDPPPCR